MGAIKTKKQTYKQKKYKQQKRSCYVACIFFSWGRQPQCSSGSACSQQKWFTVNCFLWCCSSSPNYRWSTVFSLQYYGYSHVHLRKIGPLWTSCRNSLAIHSDTYWVATQQPQPSPALGKDPLILWHFFLSLMSLVGFPELNRFTRK